MSWAASVDDNRSEYYKIWLNTVFFQVIRFVHLVKWKFSTFCCLSGTNIYQKQKKNNRPTWSQKPSPKQWTRMEFLCWLFVGVCTWSSRCNFFQKMSKKLQVLDQVHFKKRLDQPTFVICLSHWKPRNLLRPPQLWARWSDPFITN